MQREKEILELQKEIFEANKAKGFWNDAGTRDKAEAVALINSELYESLEAHRKGRTFSLEEVDFRNYDYANDHIKELSDALFWDFMEKHVKDTFQDELADTAIRILDYTGGFDIRLVPTTEIPFEFLEPPSKGSYGASILSANNYIISAYRQELVSVNVLGSMISYSWSAALLYILYLADLYNINLYHHIIWKLRYNALRPHKHGKKY
jgi:hypothetical protein